VTQQRQNVPSVGGLLGGLLRLAVIGATVGLVASSVYAVMQITLVQVLPRANQAANEARDMTRQADGDIQMIEQEARAEEASGTPIPRGDRIAIDAANLAIAANEISEDTYSVTVVALLAAFFLGVVAVFVSLVAFIK
jgi:hypothetical protein